MLRRRLLLSAALAVGFAVVPQHEAGAQTVPSNLTAQCVGGVLGCTQVDFFLLLEPGQTTTLDFFHVMLTSPGWSFVDPNMSDAADSNGDDPFVDPTVVTPQHMSAAFLFPAFVNDLVPLRMRFEVVPGGGGIAGTYTGGTPGDPTAVAGTFGANVVPEPGSMLLLGTGLAGLGAARWRSRRRGGLPGQRLTS